MNPDHEFTEAEELAWVAEQRAAVVDHLQQEQIKHGEIGEWPAWYAQPYLAIFALESAVEPGYMGYWVICGDLPTDVVTFSEEIDDPRKAMNHFADTWSEVADQMLKGKPHPDVKIGTPDEWPELGKHLKPRAIMLKKIVEDDENWDF